MKILVTGAAGFIGYHLCQRLLKEGHNVIGLDNINDYYSTNLKFARLYQLGIEKEQAEVFNELSQSQIYFEQFRFIRLNLEDRENLPIFFNNHDFDVVCNLAAQAGVRYSIENPLAYVDSNLVGFVNLLECIRHRGIKNFIYASSSSVYGQNDNIPFSTEDKVDHPISLYAATKKSNELLAHTYSHLYGIQTTGLRFFTVYGPWGRPDMAIFLFTEALFKNKEIKVFNQGNLSRDFTYIDDVVNGIIPLVSSNNSKNPLYSLYNIGNGKPIKLLDFISALEAATGISAKKIYLPMQPGDVEKTWADCTNLAQDFNFKANTDINYGVKNFVKWFKKYYKLL